MNNTFQNYMLKLGPLFGGVMLPNPSPAEVNLSNIYAELNHSSDAEIHARDFVRARKSVENVLYAVVRIMKLIRTSLEVACRSLLSS